MPGISEDVQRRVCVIEKRHTSKNTHTSMHPNCHLIVFFSQPLKSKWNKIRCVFEYVFVLHHNISFTLLFRLPRIVLPAHCIAFRSIYRYSKLSICSVLSFTGYFPATFAVTVSHRVVHIVHHRHFSSVPLARIAIYCRINGPVVTYLLWVVFHKQTIF